MKLSTLFVVAAALLCLTPSMALPDDAGEKAAIEKAITDFYIGGLKANDPNLLDQIFHQEWTLMYIRDGEFSKIDRETYLGFADPAKPSPFADATFEIAYIDVTGTAANAKIIIDAERGTITDYFNMLKVDDRWWIVSKISNSVRK